ncbi:MAG: HAD-IIB family hydrolase [Vulcanimicrobiota bacterium]
MKLFCSDLDGTLVGNPEGTDRFRRAWRSISRPPLLVYSSGRLLVDILNLLQVEPLPQPDYVIGGVGTQIYDFNNQNLLDEFEDQLQLDWQLSQVEALIRDFPGVQPQPGEFQHRFKSSWFLPRATRQTLQRLQDLFESHDLKVKIVYSSLRDLDLLPVQASKGNALMWLMQRLGISGRDCLVAGDSGNDSSMFAIPEVRGIVVDNAQPELFEAVIPLPVYTSLASLADGVVEGLDHYGLLERLPAHRAGLAGVTRDSALQRLLELEDPGGLNSQEKELVARGYDEAIATIRRNITPLGFSACSLSDNEVLGTDENYRSVWARDSCMTIVGTALLAEDDIRRAQRATLETLIQQISPVGQIPSNIRIDTGVADYSGVGGICSVDSGLWFILGFYNYIRVSNDLTFLKRSARALQSAMTWLAAHDSNNDGLLEIPEAGDWTDLFARSYNVLYDEVLWYRCQLCYGRLLEWMGKGPLAADYFSNAHRVRAQILDRFWPDTSRTIQTFAALQFSLGDVSYLLAEITPFGFSWRCDVLGNLLAFLFHVVDIDKARRTFQFLWGVGINDPHPVACLYPPVNAGDPDWKPYYTTNLLNLPGHYHNGGIWPMVGGYWVRYLHRLGLHQLACRELYRLALLNQQGIRSDWEFNEWSHGRTGKPMGKRYQAWSAASYIRACQELGMAGEIEELP